MTTKRPDETMAEGLSPTLVLQALNAAKRGDFSARLPDGLSGIDGQIAEAFNLFVEQNETLSNELAQLQLAVGTEGITNKRISREGMRGGWARRVDSVNKLVEDVTRTTAEMARVVSAVSKGDLTQFIDIESSAGKPMRGDFLRYAKMVNGMVEQLGTFGSEVSRVAWEVGVEGKLGAVASVKGVSGIWKELTDNVNSMATNLTNQVRNIAEVTTAVAKGDLSQKISVEAKGEILQLKNTINTMVDQLSSFAAEVTRVAGEVGTEGRLGGQALVKGVSGTWKELTDNVNLMASNLTSQMRNIAEVTTAVAKGDLSRTITVDARGEILQLKNTVNFMVEKLRSFGAEVTRVAREVGTEGILGGQADVKGVSGTWKELTDNVNLMASNLTSQMHNIAEVTTAVAKGDLSQKISVEAKGEILQLKNTINTMVDQLSSFAAEVTRVAGEVGTEGRLGGQALVKGVSGTWKELTDNVNLMASNLTSQMRNIAEVTTAVAKGDLSQKISVEAKGEILQLKNTINTMVDQLSSFAAEVTRVAGEVGTEGRLGGQALVKGVSGTWKELTDNVNLMASNLTSQMRNIAEVTTAVAQGDLSQKISVEAKGEIQQLKDTINTMVDQLSSFAAEVTRVAHEVGVEGKLGGQADVPEAAGIWRDLTNNVNELARNLTNQVRAIGEVATAVTKGDLTRSINAVAKGELADLKDNVNQMISTLGETTRINQEQDWLKTNLAKFSRMLQGQRSVLEVAKMVLSELAPVVSAQHGVFYIAEKQAGEPVLKLFATYAYKERKNVANHFRLGEGLVGQCALEKQRILLTEVPGDYIQINSGLGQSKPLDIVVIPITFETEVKGVIELASFQRFNNIQLSFMEQLLESLGIVLATIEAQMRTDELLKQSQGLTEELQTQQEELKQTNEELEEKAQQLSEQKTEVERKNREVEDARLALVDKAEQLALTSKYKSEFLANMSHELRTPLNSLMLLSQQLAENIDGNLSEKQVDHARTIHSSGADLLALINEVLDLAKVESGIMTINVGEVDLVDMGKSMKRNFDQTARQKKLDFTLTTSEKLPRSIQTDQNRLAQILRNLLSNAFKFTDKGSVHLAIAPVTERSWSADNETLNRARHIISFTVTDTGIGIPKDKQFLIFEAFQQVDGSASRKYGGTGLGLSISRELANRLGGELRVASELGSGSTFTLYLPDNYTGSNPVKEQITVVPPSPAASPEVLPNDGHAPRGSGDDCLSPLIPDDRNTVVPGDRTLLIIEDDAAFAGILRDQARDKGFKVLAAGQGQSGLALASKYLPDAVTLDLRLPDIHGWVVLDRLKHDPATRHIPVHVISAAEDERKWGLEHGAIAFLPKPVDQESLNSAIDGIAAFVERKVRNLLVVEDNEAQRKAIIELIGNHDVETTAVESGEKALELLEKKKFDCMVVDLSLPGISGFDLIRDIKESDHLRDIPIIVYTGKNLTPAEETELRKLAETIIVKDVKSPERLLDETALFLHRVESNLPEQKQKMLRKLYQSDPALEGKKILIVDDDIRNIFAVTSLLERHKIEVFRAENGKEGIAALEKNPGIGLVLMDIMMPEMDGYEAIQAIRAKKKFKKLPIIALTAKAMVGDRQKCIDAGASDYITKPIDTEQMLSLLRVWLYR